MKLNRAAFELPDGVVRIVILCEGCSHSIAAKLDGKRRWIKAMLEPGDGECEFCIHQIKEEAGAG